MKTTMLFIISLFVFVNLQGQSVFDTIPLKKRVVFTDYNELGQIYTIGIDSLIVKYAIQELLFQWDRYSEECYKDSVKVCRFSCYNLAEDGQIKYWGKFDCEYYREYQSIYYCTDRYNDWIHPNEPTLKGFIEWLKSKAND